MVRFLAFAAIVSSSALALAEPALPGQLWRTPVVPWHLPFDVSSLALDGDRAFVGTKGALARVDLKTGAFEIHALTGRAAKMTIDSIVHLRDGRWLLVGHEASTTFVVAATLDPATYATTPIALVTGSRSGFNAPRAALLADGSVVITGSTLPLAIYDPKTWKPTVTLATEIGWDAPVVVGSVLVAHRGEDLVRFDVTTKARAVLGHGDVGAVFDKVSVRHDAGRVVLTTDGATPAPLAPVAGLVADPAGKRFVTTIRGELRVYASTGTLVRTIKLPEGERPTVFAWAGDRMVFQTNGELRVLDVATGTMSVADHVERTAIAVDDAGAILAIGGHTATLVENGRVTKTDALGGAVPVTVAEDARHYLTDLTGDRIELHDVGAPKPSAGWDVPDYFRGVPWFGADATSIVVRVEDPAGTIRRSRGVALDALVVPHEDSTVVATGAGDVAIALPGRVALVELASGKTRMSLRTPACGEGVVAIDATRVITTNFTDIAVWERATGKLVASAELPGSIDAIELAPDNEILVATSSAIIAWTPNKALRTIPIGANGASAIAAFDVSPNGKRLAVATVDDRVALLDLEAVRAQIPVEKLPSALKMPASCKAADPTKRVTPVPRDEPAYEPTTGDGGSTPDD